MQPETRNLDCIPPSRRVQVLYLYLDESGDIEWPPKGHSHICLTLLAVERRDDKVVSETKRNAKKMKRQEVPKHEIEKIVTRTIYGLRHHLLGKHQEGIKELDSEKVKPKEWIQKRRIPELKGWNHSYPLLGINNHLEDIGRQFYSSIANVDGFYLATVIFNKWHAYQKAEKLYCTIKNDCKEFLKWKYAGNLLDHNKTKIEQIQAHSKAFKIGKVAENKIQLLERRGVQARRSLEKIIEKEAERAAHRGVVKNYSTLLKSLLIELGDCLPLAEQVVLVVDRKFERKMDTKQLAQIIIETIRGRMGRPRPQVIFGDSKSAKCLQVVDLFCNLFYSYKDYTLDIPPNEEVPLKSELMKQRLAKKWFDVYELLKPKIAVWQLPESWAEVDQKARGN